MKKGKTILARVSRNNYGYVNVNPGTDMASSAATAEKPMNLSLVCITRSSLLTGDSTRQLGPDFPLGVRTTQYGGALLGVLCLRNPPPFTHCFLRWVRF